MKKQLVAFMLSLCFWTITVAAAEDSAKAVLISTARIDSSALISAQLADLSPSAIERGLKDVQILARSRYNKQNQVFTMEWHSITKTVNGTEHSKSLTEVLTTQLKMNEGVTEVSVGETVIVRGDLESLLDDFDTLMRDAQSNTEITNEKNVDASTTNNSDNPANNAGSGGSGGGGFLSNDGLTQNPDVEGGGIKVDKISSTAEKCSLNIDWSSMNVFQQERVIKKSTETGETTDIGSCYNVGTANKIEKDYAASCNIQINGLQSYAKGFIFYSIVDGNRIDLSGCRYESEEAEPLLVRNDFAACKLDLASVNLSESKFYPAAIKYSIINGKRYNLTECEVIADAPQSLPTRTESCDVTHSVGEMTSFTMQRVDTYDPLNKELLRKGECQRHISFPILKDYEAGCSIQFSDDGSFIKGFKYYSNIENKRHEISSCEYDESEMKKANVLKDFDKCSINLAKVNANEGNFNPAFVKYTIVDGKRYEISGCETSIEDSRPLPVRVEVCPLEHSIPAMKTYRMERKDTYDPSNKTRLVEGDCYSIEEIAIQRDFDAGCSIQVNPTFNTYIRGYKFFSTVDGKKHVLSECEYNITDAIALDRFKDYAKCSLDEAVIDIANSNYQPSFVQYTLIDSKRYELTGCMNEATDIRPLPIRTAKCDANYEFGTGKAYDMERKDIYDPANKIILKEGDCYPTLTFDIARDFDVKSCVNLPDYVNKKLARSYRSFIMRDGKKEYISECTLDFDNRIDILQEIGSCKASENLSSNIATLQKRWYWVRTDGSNEYISACMPSDETYPIVLTENTCSPTILAGSNKVVIQNRKGWKDGNGDWHYVTACAPTSTEALIKVEVCASPKYEHDFVGGQSYLRTRNYYEHNGQKTYVTACGRDSSTSYPHFKSSNGCTVEHDDANLRSRLFSKTIAKLQEGDTQIKGCEAVSQYIPYTYIGVTFSRFNGISGHSTYTFSIRQSSPLTLTNMCERAGSQGFSYNKTLGDLNVREDVCQGFKDGIGTCIYTATVASEHENNTYRRSDNSVYHLPINSVCRGL